MCYLLGHDVCNNEGGKERRKGRKERGRKEEDSEID